MIINFVNSFPLFQLSLSDVCADESYEFEPCQDLGRGLGSRKTGLSPPVIVLLTIPRQCFWCGSCLSDLNTVLFHIIIVDNYDYYIIDIPDDLVVKVILARNTLDLVAASMSTYHAQITW